MKHFAAMALVASLAVLTACHDGPPPPAATQTDNPGPNPDCKYETQAGDCVPGN